jgi:hypothetical protein
MDFIYYSRFIAGNPDFEVRAAGRSITLIGQIAVKRRLGLKAHLLGDRSREVPLLGSCQPASSVSRHSEKRVNNMESHLNPAGWRSSTQRLANV